MPRDIKKFSDNSKLEYDSGYFDDWCVYLTKPGEKRYAPRDTDYFSRLNELNKVHGNNTIYNDFVRIYYKTTNELEPDILNYITELALGYGENQIEIDIWFTVIYAGMIAEENKANTRLGKRVKRLGMHQVLIEKMAPDKAANFSKGKNWKELDKIMKAKGI